MFTAGQEVWCLIYGHGVITEVDNKRFEDTYPVLAKFQKNADLIISYTADGKFHNQGNITLFPYPVEVVKAAIIKPSIDWSQIKDEYKWLAVDENDSAFVFEKEPSIDGAPYWYIGGTYFEVNGLVSYSRGTCDWKYSLVKRPEGDSHDG